MNLRRKLPLLLAAALALPARADKDSLAPAPDSSDALRRQSIQAGLEYLRKIQNVDGSFGQSENGIVGVTALSLLAFLSAGNQDGRGPYGEVVSRGVDFLMKCSLPPGEKDPTISVGGKPPGYLYRLGDSDSNMHGHGYATQVLVLVYGSGKSTSPRSRQLKRTIEGAIRVIENAQTITGGWGYQPNPATFHEGSVTVTVVQALRLAADAGFLVDKEVRQRGLRYLHDSQKRDGSFRYSITTDRSSAALTAAAITALHGFAEYYSDAERAGMEYLRSKYEHFDGLQWPFYANYYAAQAFYTSGGDDWRFWQHRIVPQILLEQSHAPGTEGSWDDQRSQTPRPRGRAYATAMSVLALSVSDGYLPLFQR